MTVLPNFKILSHFIILFTTKIEKFAKQNKIKLVAPVNGEVPEFPCNKWIVELVDDIKPDISELMGESFFISGV